MPITSAHERPQPSTSAAGFSDAVTFAFGDPAADVYGVARVGLSSAAPGGDGVGERAGRRLRRWGGGGRARGGRAGGRRWRLEGVDAAGVRCVTVVPLAEWTVAFVSEDGAVALDLRFAAVSAPGEIAAGSAVAEAGGMRGYEQLCRVTGTARVRGGERSVDCLGQRGHSWGAPDWERITVARSVGAWVDEDLGIAVTAVRGVKANSHADEALASAVFVRVGDGEGDGDGARLASAFIAEDTRLTTTYDSEGRQRRAGLEVYEDEDAYPHRGAGEVVCGTSLDLGRLRLDCAFFHWRLDGREGVGRYDVLRRAADVPS